MHCYGLRLIPPWKKGDLSNFPGEFVADIGNLSAGLFANSGIGQTVTERWI